ncbi:MAG: phage tail tape measure protein [Alphaproteobacteria bacterium]
MASPTKSSVSIAIGAELGKSFRGSFGSANKQISQLGTVIKKLDSHAASMDSFKKSKTNTVKAYQAWQQAQKEAQKLGREIRQADKPTKALTNSFRKARNSVRLTKSEMIATRSATQQMGSALRKAGLDTNNLSKAQTRLGKNLTALKKRQASLSGVRGAQDANMTKRSSYRSQMTDAVALGGAFYGAIRPAVDFELAMAKVGAITNEAADSKGFGKLKDQARLLGRTTQYTSSQSAEAMQFLAMTGMKTNQILDATPHVLNMAIAANMDLGRAADIASNILSGFNMEASRAGEVADVLAQASRTTNVDVEMLGQTMKFVAPAVAAVGGSLQETAALAGVLGDAGIQATMAGTMLRSSYLRLAAPAKAGAKALGEMREEMGVSAEEMPDVAKQAMLAQKRMSGLGVKVFDGGKMRSMVDILKDMTFALKGASDEEKLSAVKDIFGTRAASGALAIFKSIETGRLDEVVEKINNADGAAKEMAERLKNTTFGAFKQFGSAMESVGISAGSVLLPAFRDIALGAADVASWINITAEQFPMVTQAVGLTIAGLVSFKIAAIGMGYAWTFIKGGFLSAKASVVGFRTALTLMRLTMTSVRFGGIISGLLSFGGTLLRLTMGAIPAMITAVRGMNIAFMLSPVGAIVTALAAGAGLVIHYWTPISKFFGKIFAPVIEIFKSVWAWLQRIITPLKSVGKWVGHAWQSGAGKNQMTPQAVNDNQPPQVGRVAQELARVERSGGERSNIVPLTKKPAIHTDRKTDIRVEAPITIHAAEGMSEQKIAHQVKVALKETMRESQARKRAANYD